ERIAAETPSLSAVAEYNINSMSLTTGGEAVRVTLSTVSKQFFDVLGVKSAMGRFFRAEEQQIGAPLAGVISHGLWVRELGASSRAIGAKLMSGRTALTVVGILPAGQEFPAGVDVWIPREDFARDVSYTAHNWRVIARVKDGVPLTQADRELSTVLRRLHNVVGDQTSTFDGQAIALREQIVGPIKPLLLLVLAASGVLLVIAC